MTISEYAEKTFQKLVSNARNYPQTIDEAERVLNNSGINPIDKKQFWIELYNLLNSMPRRVVGSQGGDSLSKIIAEAKGIIAKKAS
ncbi:hypothetical protein SNR26_08845 [Pectobacterium brasiliense]|uniref:hypothetical protein n=1 Tax=Pectobacterium brasiliense TaxID=180957 RepID=UPI002A81B0C8|nr:hypothetical protein [Pectobacterium brasiliense]MDY4368006.1 hypothetical protein [Pectobacterium brasiliense]MDY7057357.1 hypothetical protein [Pectobacterium brasiliense]